MPWQNDRSAGMLPAYPDFRYSRVGMVKTLGFFNFLTVGLHHKRD